MEMSLVVAKIQREVFHMDSDILKKVRKWQVFLNSKYTSGLNKTLIYNFK